MVAEIAASSSEGIRCTTSGAIAFVGVARIVADHMVEQLRRAGWSTDASDPVHSVSACVGAPGCASSRADTRIAAAVLLRDRRSEPGAAGPSWPHVHLSGCEKSCGATGGATLLIADECGDFAVEQLRPEPVGR